MKTILLAIILQPFFCFAQNNRSAQLEKDCYDFFIKNKIKITRKYQHKADSLAGAIIMAYSLAGEDGMDKLLDMLDSSWYHSMKLYLDPSPDNILQEIEIDKATFQDKDIRIVTLSARYVYETYIVAIYTFP